VSQPLGMGLGWVGLGRQSMAPTVNCKIKLSCQNVLGKEDYLIEKWRQSSASPKMAMSECFLEERMGHTSRL